MNQAANDMLEKIKQEKKRANPPTVKLDSETARIVKSVWPGSMREGVAWLVKVGSEALNEAKKESAKPAGS